MSVQMRRWFQDTADLDLKGNANEVWHTLASILSNPRNPGIAPWPASARPSARNQSSNVWMMEKF